MTQISLEPTSIDDSSAVGRWMVVIYDNEHNTVDEVVMILIRATKCSHEEAAIETWEAHHHGKAAVHFDTKEICNHVAQVISSIGVQTEVCKEWDD